MVPSLIIFDCDGVLVDSEPLSNRVLAEQITDLGYGMTEQEALQEFAGGSIERVRSFVKNKTGYALPPNFEEEYRIKSTALFNNELKAIAGIERLLDSITLPKCVGSNGPFEKIVRNLQITGLDHYFGENLFSAYDIKRWKPEPELYLHAAKMNNVEAHRCIVVEDSLFGVLAARAAGMKVFAYASHLNSQTLSEAGAIVFEEMESLIGKLVL